MSRILILSALMLSSVPAVTVVGCGDRTKMGASSGESPRNQNPKTTMPDDDTERSKTYVTCRATLTALKKDYAWFDDTNFGHDDGVSPLASFVLVEPSTYNELAIGILFKHTSNDAVTWLPDAADIGRQFSVQIPEDFLKSKSDIIDILRVRHFRKIEP